MDIVIVGAGMSGLIAAGVLQRAGHHVTLLDKGRSVGGRLATRRLAGAVVDHGAQFFTVRSAEMADLTRAWLDAGVVRVWCEGFAAHDGHPRYVATNGMNALAKHLAAELTSPATDRPAIIRCDTLVFSITPAETTGRWRVGLDDGTAVEADGLVVTCPLPQSYSLLVASGVALPGEMIRTEYDRTLGLLAVLDRPSAVPPPGGVQLGDETFSFIGDNQAKGISPVPAVTFHAHAAWSEAHWDDDPTDALAALVEAARPWLGDATIVDQQLKRWRFATPRTVWPEPYWLAGADLGAAAPLALAGDAFAGPKVEGAAMSGLAAGRAVAAALGSR